MTLSLLVPQAAAWFAIRGVIPSVPITWMLSTAFYSWAAPSVFAVDNILAGSSSPIDGDYHEIQRIDGDDVEGVECAAAADTERDEDAAMDWESTMAQSPSIQNDDLHLVHDDEDNCVEDEDDDEEEEYNPIGLQIWPNGKTTR